MRLEQIEANKQKQVAESAAKIQTRSTSALIEQAKKLFEQTKQAGSGLNNLRQVLDNIFGKDIERIAKRFGVGQDIAAIRTTTRTF